MNVSVILCTYNRCQSLAKTLGSLVASSLPDSVEWEVLVVDNNSTDRTREVVEDFCRRYAGRFRYLFEPEQGKSRALNAGVREARGEILAFTDDDVTVEPAWMQNLTAGLHNGEWAGAGGRTLPGESFSLPRWLSLEERYALAPLAIFDLGTEACVLNEEPYGNNMAFRKVMFEKYGGFRSDLGPCSNGRNPQRAEDSEFGHRLLAGGERLRYESSAVLYHSVPKERLQKSYFLAWWLEKARSDIAAFGSQRPSRWRVAGIPLVLFRRLAASTLRWMFAIEPSRRFRCKRMVWTTAGAIAECYLRSRRPSLEHSPDGELSTS
jgi:glucosyl-dolichyl phosphate glucuronosyltransferase